MTNEYNTKIKKCPLIADFCDKKHKDCNICIGHEECWQTIQCYMECHNYDWSYKDFKKHYNEYYKKGLYCANSLLDIINNNLSECQNLFENEEDLV